MTPIHVTTGPRLLFSSPGGPCVKKSGRVDGRPFNLPMLDQVTNLGPDDVPDTIERGVKDSSHRLHRDMGVSADRLGEGCSEVIRTVNKFRVVAVPGDAVIKRPPLVIVGGALGGVAEGGEIERHPGQVA